MMGNLHRLESRVINSVDNQLAHSGAVYSLCKVNETCFASSSLDRLIRIWDYETSNLVESIDVKGCCRYFVCEDHLLIGTSENRVIVIDSKTNGIVVVIPCKHKINSLLLIKNKELNGNIILAGDCIGNINIIIDYSNIVQQIQSYESFKYSGGHRGTINVMHQIKECPSCFISAGEYGEIKLWDAQTFEFAGQLLGHDTSKSVYYLESLSIETRLTLISGSSDQTIRIWDLQSQSNISLLRLSEPVYAACLINKNELIVGDKCAVRIIRLNGIDAINTESVSLEKHSSRVNAVCRISDTCFATGDTQGNIITWTLSKFDNNSDFKGEFGHLSSNQQEGMLNENVPLLSLIMSDQVTDNENKGIIQRQMLSKMGNNSSNLSQKSIKNNSSRKLPQRSLQVELESVTYLESKTIHGKNSQFIEQEESQKQNHFSLLGRLNDKSPTSDSSKQGLGLLSGLKKGMAESFDNFKQTSKILSNTKRNKQEFPNESQLQMAINSGRENPDEKCKLLFDGNEKLPPMNSNRFQSNLQQEDNNFIETASNPILSQLNRDKDSFQRGDDELEGEEIRSEYLLKLERNSVLESENEELKEKVKEQQIKLNKYEDQIQQLLETLQKSEEERLSIISSFKDAASKIQESSELIKELKKRTTEQEEHLLKKDIKIDSLQLTLKQQIQMKSRDLNGLTIIQQGPQQEKLQNYQKIVLEEQMKNLQREISKLKQETSECENESELVILLEELQFKHSLFEQKKIMLLEIS